MNSIRGKNSFTLIELVIVLVIILGSYFLIFSNSNFDTKEQKVRLGLENIKAYLLENFEFEKELAFVCIEDKLTCFIRVDNEYNEELKIENFFSNIPEIYEYNKDEIRVEFLDIKIGNNSFRPIFELKINSDHKTNEFIVSNLDNRVYVFNSIYTKPLIYKDIKEAFETFYNNEIEVRDAF